MTRGRENPACSITETGKRADSVRMLHSHHSPDSPPGPEAAGKSEAEEVRRNRGFVNASVREGYRTGLRSNPSSFFIAFSEAAAAVLLAILLVDLSGERVSDGCGRSGG